jgi:hypothetical protein
MCICVCVYNYNRAFIHYCNYNLALHEVTTGLSLTVAVGASGAVVAGLCCGGKRSRQQANQVAATESDIAEVH